VGGRAREGKPGLLLSWELLFCRPGKRLCGWEKKAGTRWKWRSNNEEFLALLNMSTSKIDYEGKVKGEI
jgi:hypothetical protein